MRSKRRAVFGGARVASADLAKRRAVAARLDARRNRLNEIKGMVPSLHNLPQGCTFAPRCEFATDQCRAAYPPLVQHRPGHAIACWHADKLLAGAA